MAKQLFGLSLDDVRILKELVRWWRSRGGSRRPVPVRRRVHSGGSSGNVIYAQVNEASGVTSGDSTFSFDNAVAEVGSIPTDGEGTAQNQYGQEYADNEWVHLFQRKDNGQWLTERGGTAGSQVVYFELTENKSYGDAAKLAKPVLADGTLDSGAPAFHVIDDQRQFYGRAAAGGQEGYRGMAVRLTDDYSEGVPGFRIATMEGPAQLLVVMLDENLSGASADCSLAESPNVFGLAYRGRLPLPVESVDVVVYDDLSVATNAKSGEKWIASWNEVSERYLFWRKLVGTAPPPIPATAMITSTCAAMATSDGATKTATPGLSTDDEAATIVKWSTTLPPTLSADASYDPMPVLNLTETVLIGSTSNPQILQGYIQEFIDEGDPEDEEDDTTVYCFVFGGPFDIRSLTNYAKDTKQILFHAEDESNAKLGGEDCES